MRIWVGKSWTKVYVQKWGQNLLNINAVKEGP